MTQFYEHTPGSTSEFAMEAARHNSSFVEPTSLGSFRADDSHDGYAYVDVEFEAGSGILKPFAIPLEFSQVVAPSNPEQAPSAIRHFRLSPNGSAICIGVQEFTDNTDPEQADKRYRTFSGRLEHAARITETEIGPRTTIFEGVVSSYSEIGPNTTIGPKTVLNHAVVGVTGHDSRASSEQTYIGPDSSIAQSEIVAGTTTGEKADIERSTVYARLGATCTVIEGSRVLGLTAGDNVTIKGNSVIGSLEHGLDSPQSVTVGNDAAVDHSTIDAETRLGHSIMIADSKIGSGFVSGNTTRINNATVGRNVHAEGSLSINHDTLNIHRVQVGSNTKLGRGVSLINGTVIEASISPSTNDHETTYIGDRVALDNTRVGNGARIGNDNKFHDSSIGASAAIGTTRDIRYRSVDVGNGTRIDDRVQTPTDRSILIGSNAWIGSNARLEADVPPKAIILPGARHTQTGEVGQIVVPKDLRPGLLNTLKGNTTWNRREE